MLGHWRPLFMGFKRGGKIVATTGGAFLGVAPIVGGIGAGVWIVVFLLFRYASLASIVAGLSLPALAVRNRRAVAGDRLRRRAAAGDRAPAQGEHPPPRGRNGEPGDPEPAPVYGLERGHRQAPPPEPVPVVLGHLAGGPTRRLRCRWCGSGSRRRAPARTRRPGAPARGRRRRRRTCCGRRSGRSRARDRRGRCPCRGRVAPRVRVPVISPATPAARCAAPVALPPRRARRAARRPCRSRSARTSWVWIVSRLTCRDQTKSSPSSSG